MARCRVTVSVSLLLGLWTVLSISAIPIAMGAASSSSSSSSGTAERDAVICALQQRLRDVSLVIHNSKPISASGEFHLNCSCEEYCTGRCFSMQCAPCAPSAFSFPGGEALCLAVGPLGTGLLCHVDLDGNVTENACCSHRGPTCWLPQGSCCASGDCTSCPTHRYPNNESLLFPPLQRKFVNDTCEADGG